MYEEKGQSPAMNASWKTVGIFLSSVNEAREATRQMHDGPHTSLVSTVVYCPYIALSLQSYRLHPPGRSFTPDTMAFSFNPSTNIFTDHSDVTQWVNRCQLIAEVMNCLCQAVTVLHTIPCSFQYWLPWCHVVCQASSIQASSISVLHSSLSIFIFIKSYGRPPCCHDNVREACGGGAGAARTLSLR